MPRQFKPLILWLPRPIHNSPFGIAIGMLLFLVGLSYMITGGQQGSIGALLDNATGIRVWGFSMCLGAIAKVVGVMTNNLDMEKLGCRLLSLAILIFSIWIVIGTGTRATATLGFSILLIIALQIRVGIIKQLQSPWIPPPIVTKLNEGERDGG